MDFTKIPRIIIYKDRDDIDDFPVDSSFDFNSMEEAFMDDLERCPFIRNAYDAPELILRIFNNARYITTLIFIENHPNHYFQKYLEIAGPKGSDYITANYVVPATMALVINYLYQYLNQNESNSKIVKNITEYFSKWDMNNDPDGKKVFFDLLILHTSDHPRWLTDDNFEPRLIYDVIDDPNVTAYDLTHGINYILGDFMGRVDTIEEEIPALKKMQKKLEEWNPSDFDNVLEKNEAIIKIEDRLKTLDPTLFCKREQAVIAVEIDPDDNAILQARIAELEKENNELKNQQSQTAESIEGENIEVLKEEINNLKEEISDLEKREGIDAPKAALLIRIACSKLGGLPSNRENAWPLISNLWGCKESIARRRLKESVKEGTIEELAKRIEVVSPYIAKIIRQEGMEIIKKQKKLKDI
jgi:hypothetical protein